MKQFYQSVSDSTTNIVLQAPLQDKLNDPRDVI